MLNFTSLKQVTFNDTLSKCNAVTYNQSTLAWSTLEKENVPPHCGKSTLKLMHTRLNKKLFAFWTVFLN